MDVVLHSADAMRKKTVLPGDPRQILPHSGLKILRQERLSILRPKHQMVMQARVCVRHRGGEEKES